MTEYEVSVLFSDGQVLEDLAYPGTTPINVVLEQATATAAEAIETLSDEDSNGLEVVEIQVIVRFD